MRDVYAPSHNGCDGLGQQHSLVSDGCDVSSATVACKGCVYNAKRIAGDICSRRTRYRGHVMCMETERVPTEGMPCDISAGRVSLCLDML